jgi:hypothetical protein
MNFEGEARLFCSLAVTLRFLWALLPQSVRALNSCDRPVVITVSALLPVEQPEVFFK